MSPPGRCGRAPLFVQANAGETPSRVSNAKNTTHCSEHMHSFMHKEFIHTAKNSYARTNHWLGCVISTKAPLLRTSIKTPSVFQQLVLVCGHARLSRRGSLKSQRSRHSGVVKHGNRSAAERTPTHANTHTHTEIKVPLTPMQCRRHDFWRGTGKEPLTHW